MASVVEELLAECRTEALHLEMRDDYSGVDVEFADWAAGKDLDLAGFGQRAWHGLVSGAVGRGAVVRRARVVSEPVSEYIRYEHWLTANNVSAGEQVRWLPRRQVSDLMLPGNDFWLFDSSVLVINHFSGAGGWAGGQELWEGDPGVATRCREAFEAVWARAIPHEEYRLD